MERYCAWIRIGGQIDRSNTGPLLKAIGQTNIRLNWGEPPFEPTTADELLDVRQEGRLWLCDEEAGYGEFPDLEDACCTLGLGYQRFCEAGIEHDAEIVDWRPGWEEPLIRTCATDDSNVVLVDGHTAREALAALQAGQTSLAMGKLQSLCPDVPDLPPFEIA